MTSFRFRETAGLTVAALTVGKRIVVKNSRAKITYMKCIT
jgi:hypothetical protein